MSDANVVPFTERKKSLNARGALAYLAKVAEGHPDGVVEVDSITHLGILLAWSQPRVSKQLKAWREDGRVTVERTSNRKLQIRILPSREDLERAGMPSKDTHTRRPGRTRARRASGARPKRPANIDAESTSHDNRLNSAGTQTMAKPTSADAPSDTPASAASQSVPTNAGTPNSLIFPRVADVDWRLLERAGGKRDRAPPMDFMDVLIVLIIFGLTGVPALLSVHGMQGLFSATPWEATFLGCALEGAKLGTSVWLAMRWDYFDWGHRLPLVAFIFAIACINAISVYSQLVASHLSVVGVEQVAYQRSDADTNGKVSRVETRVSDFTSRIAQLDAERAAIRGRSHKAMNARGALDQKREQLVSDRDKAQRELGELQTSRSESSAKHQATINEALPLQYVADSFGNHMDGEQVIRWLIAGIVLCADPFALMLAHAFGSTRRRRQPA